MVIFGVRRRQTRLVPTIYPFFIDFIDPQNPDPVPGPYFLSFLSIFLDFTYFGVFLPILSILGVRTRTWPRFTVPVTDCQPFWYSFLAIIAIVVFFSKYGYFDILEVISIRYCVF